MLCVEFTPLQPVRAQATSGNAAKTFQVDLTEPDYKLTNGMCNF